MTTEADIVKDTIKKLRKVPKCHAVKIHGDMYQERGVPDVMGCYKGKSFVVEMKRPGKEGNVSRYQQKHLDAFIKSGSIAIVATSAAEVLKAIGAR